MFRYNLCEFFYRTYGISVYVILLVETKQQGVFGEDADRTWLSLRDLGPYAVILEKGAHHGILKVQFYSWVSLCKYAVKLCGAQPQLYVDIFMLYWRE